MSTWCRTRSRPVPLRWCSKCRENSIVSEVKTRKRDQARVHYEYCINANPDCKMRRSRILGEANEDRKEKAGAKQLDLFHS